MADKESNTPDMQISAQTSIRGEATERRQAITLVSPFPRTEMALIWKWLQEFPDNNFDDYGPKDQYHFELEMYQRRKHERTWGVRKAGKLCGIIAYLPLSVRSGSFHGICLAREVHGTGVARRAVRMVLQELFALGIQKVSAGYFSDNQRVERLLLSLGAQYEGTLMRHTLRHGQPVDMRQIAFFPESLR